MAFKWCQKWDLVNRKLEFAKRSDSCPQTFYHIPRIRTPLFQQKKETPRGREGQRCRKDLIEKGRKPRRQEVWKTELAGEEKAGNELRLMTNGIE